MRHDLWYALRRLRSQPWHTLVVVAIFAVGSGAALTVLRVADAVLLRGLPYRSPQELVRLYAHFPIVPTQELPESDVGYRALEHRTRTLAAVAAYRVVGVNLSVGDAPQRVLSARVTGNFFETLGIAAERGRSFLPGEETAKSPRVVLLSDALWRRSFGAKPEVVGSTIRIDGEPSTIVGIADARVAFPAADIGLWVLMDLDPVGTQPFQLGLEVLGRLRRGVVLQAAVDDATRILREVARENPGPHSPPGADVSGFRATMRPLRDDVAGGVKPSLALLTAAVVFVLGLTCINVSTLELVRSSARRGELAVRAALGADQRRLVLGALIEGALKATAGGAIGLALSSATVSVLQSLIPSALGAAESRISVGIVCGAAVTIAVCAAASGIFPVLATLSGDVASGLRDRAAVTTRRLTLVRRSLIVSQIAFACVLVDAAALMIGTVREAQRVSLGFRPSGLLVLQLSLPRESYPRSADVTTAFRAIGDNLKSIPGVTGVGLANDLPLTSEFSNTLIGVEGRPFRADGTDPSGDSRVVSSGYFDAMGIRVLAGRAFREGDSYLDGTPVVISKSMADVLFPDGADPIGHRIRTGPFAPWMSIVGVVGDVKNRSLTRPSRPELYLPFGAPRSPAGVSRDVSFVVRTSGSLTSLQSAAQRVVLQTNPDLPIYGVRPYDDVLRASQVREVATMRTLTGFAGVALVLAVAGCYAMLMFAVVQRRRELAMRRAVGATGRDIASLIAREMGQLLLAGAAIGFAGMLALASVFSRFLFGVGSLDVRATLGTLVLISVAGFGAALVPTRRAVAVDPMLVLRSD